MYLFIMEKPRILCSRSWIVEQFSLRSNTISVKIVVEVIETDIKGDAMRMYESETVELKEIYTPDLKKEVVAFANSSGGIIYIGAQDNGEITGIEIMNWKKEKPRILLR